MAGNCVWIGEPQYIVARDHWGANYCVHRLEIKDENECTPIHFLLGIIGGLYWDFEMTQQMAKLLII